MKNLKIKKLLAVAVAGILTVGLVACGSSIPTVQNQIQQRI